MRLQKLMTGALRDHLAGEPLRRPPGTEILWRAFFELSAARSGGGLGPNPIAPSEIEAWARLMRVPLEPHHAAMLMAMDRLWIDHVYTKRDKSPVAGPLNAAAFDAAFG